MRFILLISTMFLSLPVAFMWRFASTLKWLFWSHVKSETIISSSSGYFLSCYNLPVVSWLNSRSRRSVRPHSPISIARYQVFVNRGYLVERRSFGKKRPDYFARSCAFVALDPQRIQIRQDRSVFQRNYRPHLSRSELSPPRSRVPCLPFLD